MKPDPAVPCGVPHCPDPEHRPARHPLTRWGHPEILACVACYHVVRSRALTGADLFAPGRRQGKRLPAAAPQPDAATPPAPTVGRCQAEGCPDPDGGVKGVGGFPQRVTLDRPGLPAIVTCRGCHVRLAAEAIRAGWTGLAFPPRTRVLIRPEPSAGFDAPALVRAYRRAWRRITAPPKAPPPPPEPKAVMSLRDYRRGLPVPDCQAPHCPDPPARTSGGKRCSMKAFGLAGRCCPNCRDRLRRRKRGGADLLAPIGPPWRRLPSQFATA